MLGLIKYWSDVARSQEKMAATKALRIKEWILQEPCVFPSPY
jgi:hypothetical protein